jgi:hypothetical protein
MISWVASTCICCIRQMHVPSRCHCAVLSLAQAQPACARLIRPNGLHLMRAFVCGALLYWLCCQQCWVLCSLGAFGKATVCIRVTSFLVGAYCYLWWWVVWQCCACGVECQQLLLHGTQEGACRVGIT